MTVYKKWFFLTAGMAFTFVIYLIYSACCGSNYFYDNAGETSGNVAQVSTLVSNVISPSAFLGVEIIDIDEVLARQLDLKGKTGVLVNSVIPDSPASEAGLQRGDVIVSFNRRDTDDVERFRELIAEAAPGDTVRIVYVRDGRKHFAYAVLVQASPIVKTADSVCEDDEAGDWGVFLSALTDEFRDAYGIPSDIDGIIVLSVESGGLADSAGLSQGDVITGIGRTLVNDVEGFFAAVNDDTDGTVLLDLYSANGVRYVPLDSSSIRLQGEAAGVPAGKNVPFVPADSFENIIDCVPWVGFGGLLFAGFLYVSLLSYPQGSDRMRRIAQKIRSGAFTFIRQEYRIIFGIMFVVFLILLIFLSFAAALAFLLGAGCSMFAGWIGVNAATQANVRTCQGAKDSGIMPAFSIAFKGGAVMGISIASLGVVGIWMVYLYTKDSFTALSIVSIGFAFGASLVALFARVGGGIFTKAADVGADLVGKVEEGMPEDDPRNPGVIADNIGDCVGDTAGMGADLFESYAGSVIAALCIGVATGSCVACVSFPILLVSIGLIASAAGIISIKFLKYIEPRAAIRYATFISCFILIVGAFLLVHALFGGDLRLFWAALAGTVCAVLMGIESEYFTSGKPVKSIACASGSGSANTIITGFAVGFKSAIFPVVTICLTIFIAYKIAGLYGIALSAVAMLSTVGIIMSIDSYGPIADTAGGIAEMSGVGKDIRGITDEMDSLGNTTAAIGKGFAVGSAAMTTVAFFSAYLMKTGMKGLDLAHLNTSLGLLIGAVVPFGIAALIMDSVGRVAGRMVEEIRKQFRMIKGLLKGKKEPDVDRCINIVTKGSLEQLILPGLLAVLLPLIIGFTMGKEALGGFLVGATVTGVILGLVMTNAGAAWDNAKKLIEKGNYGGRGSRAHKASVIGDTVGDPLKDAAGPAMNIIIKLMAVVSLVFVPLMKLF